MNRKERQRGYNNSLDEIWEKESKFLEQIFDQGVALSSKQLMQFHDYVYHHCSSYVHNAGIRAQDPGKHLYESLTSYLDSRLKEMASQMETITEDEQLLITYAQNWQPYQKACAELDLSCRYFNVNWVTRERKEGHGHVHEIYALGMNRWMELVFRPMDRSLVNAIIRQRVYAAALVYQVLQSIVQLYANDLRQETTVRVKLINIFGMESGILQFYTKQTTAWFERILATKRYADLKPFLKYACLAMPEIEEGEKFKVILKSHIASQLKDMIKDKGPKDYVQAIQGLRHGPLERGLRQHKKLLLVIDEECRTAINSSEINHKMKSSELLVRYSHQLLTTKHASEEELQEELERIVEIVEFLFNIDQFIERYRKMLQLRQIQETSTSDNMELTMISQLTKKLGHDVTQTLSRQLQSMQNSNLTKEKFKIYLSNNDIKLGFDFRPKCFPGKDIKSKIHLILPLELQQPVEIFKSFYTSVYTDRKLEFHIEQSSGEITINIDQKTPYVARVSMLQMALLLQFNQNDRYTIEELAVQLGTQVETLIPALDGCIKERILVSDESLTSSSSVAVAREFTNRKRHLNINTAPAKQRKIISEEDTENDKELRVKRSEQLRSTLVRTMKKHKTLGHSQLRAEVMEQLRKHFTPDKKQIKKEIEHLMLKEFIERSKENPEIYIYLE